MKSTSSSIPTRSNQFPIMIELPTGENIVVLVSRDDTISNVIEQICRQERRFFDKDVYLIYGHMPLDPESRLSDLDTQEAQDGYFQLVPRACGGGGPSIGFEFNRVDQVVVRQFGQAPDYRKVSRGLNFSSVCRNPKCIAHNDSIRVPRGFGTFDIARESYNLKCPACDAGAEPSTNCGFYMARWKFEGRLKTGEPWAQNDFKVADTHEYYTFKEGNNVEWAYLNVTVTSLNESQ